MFSHNQTHRRINKQVYVYTNMHLYTLTENELIKLHFHYICATEINLNKYSCIFIHLINIYINIYAKNIFKRGYDHELERGH